MDDESESSDDDWEEEIDREQIAPSHLDLIPGESPPEYIRQCDNWSCTVSLDRNALVRLGADVHDQWLDLESENEPSSTANKIPTKSAESSSQSSASNGSLSGSGKLEFIDRMKLRASDRPFEPTIADLLLHRELSLGPMRPGKRRKHDLSWSIPWPFTSLRSRRDWDPLQRTVWYPKMKQTHMIDRAYGKGECFAVQYSPDGAFLLVAYENGGLDLVNERSESIHRIEKAHTDCTNNVCWMEDHTFVSGSDNGQVALWDLRLLTRPTQALDLRKWYDEPGDFVGESDHDRCVKDIVYQGATGKNPRLVVSTFSTYLHTIPVSGGLVGLPVRQRLCEVYNNRMAIIPADLPFGDSLLLAFHTDADHPARLAAMSAGWQDRAYPLHQPRTMDGRFCFREDVVILRRHYQSCEPYRSLTVDPLGRGLVVGVTRNSPYGLPGARISSLVYHRLLAQSTDPDAIGDVKAMFFQPQKASYEILQQPAFSPNGYFLASPQDRRVDILTSGRSAEPFSECTGGLRPFRQAAVIRLPKCGDILCCAVSPRDNVTVAAGCTLGHVHFAQPNL